MDKSVVRSTKERPQISINNINGPPLSIWNLEDYDKSRILNHRTADNNRSRKMNRNEKERLK